MTRVYIADARPEERSALRLMILDLKMKVVGEAADWSTTLAQAPVSRIDMLLVDWDLLPNSPTAALEELRRPARLHWSLSSSAIWTPVSKPHSPPVPMRLSVKVRRLSVWLTACEPSPRAFLSIDATWLTG